MCRGKPQKKFRGTSLSALHLSAQPHMTMQFFTELQKSKGLVLMRSEIKDKVCSHGWPFLSCVSLVCLSALALRCSGGICAAVDVPATILLRSSGPMADTEGQNEMA